MSGRGRPRDFLSNIYFKFFAAGHPGPAWLPRAPAGSGAPGRRRGGAALTGMAHSHSTWPAGVRGQAAAMRVSGAGGGYTGPMSSSSASMTAGHVGAEASATEKWSPPTSSSRAS